MEIIHLKTSSLQGKITIGDGALSLLPSLTAGQNNFVVTDSNVFSLYKKLFKDYFVNAEIFVIPAGEQSKTFERLGEILKKMTGAGLHRTSKLFAVGGGVVGDIGGLAAALYMRGISYVQIPTTLLAQTDSSVGGKTAVDLCGVKNIVGAFYQPDEVLIDTAFLTTLPSRELKCGLGEIVKYAALDAELFRALEGATEEKLSSPAFLSTLVSPCVRKKAKVVEADEREENERKCLNVGHTTGHAIELGCGLSHGECVLWGMWFETNLAIKYGVCEKGYGEKLLELVRTALAVSPRSEVDLDKIGSYAKRARADKKNLDDGKICMSVPARLGEWSLFSLSFNDYRDGLVELAKSLEKEGKIQK